MICDDIFDQGQGELAADAAEIARRRGDCEVCGALDRCVALSLRGLTPLAARPGFCQAILDRLPEAGLEPEDCASIEGELSAFLDLEVTDERADQIILHLAACDACTRELQGIRSLTGLLNRTLSLTAPEGFALDVFSRIDAEDQGATKTAADTKKAAPLREPIRIPQRRPLRAPLWLGAAAAAVLVAALGIGLQPAGEVPRAPALAAAEKGARELEPAPLQKVPKKKAPEGSPLPDNLRAGDAPKAEAAKAPPVATRRPASPEVFETEEDRGGRTPPGEPLREEQAEQKPAPGQARQPWGSIDKARQNKAAELAERDGLTIVLASADLDRTRRELDALLERAALRRRAFAEPTPAPRAQTSPESAPKAPAAKTAKKPRPKRARGRRAMPVPPSPPPKPSADDKGFEKRSVWTVEIAESELPGLLARLRALPGSALRPRRPRIEGEPKDGEDYSDANRSRAYDNDRLPKDNSSAPEEKSRNSPGLDELLKEGLRPQGQQGQQAKKDAADVAPVDRITLRDGWVLAGRLKLETSETLVLESAGREVTVPRERVARIERAPQERRITITIELEARK